MAGEAVPFLLLIFKTIFQGLIGRENAKVDDDCGHYFPLTADEDRLNKYEGLYRRKTNIDVLHLTKIAEKWC